MLALRNLLIVSILSCFAVVSTASNDSIPLDSAKLVYKINIKENIML